MVQKMLLITWIVAGLILGACAGSAGTPGTPPSETPAPDTPVGSGEVTPEPTEPPAEGPRGQAYVEGTELRIMESYPIQVDLHVEGNLPTPCHRFDSQVEVDREAGRIDVQIFSREPTDEDLNCIQRLEPFEENVRLGSFEGGSFDVYVNGEMVGSFDA